MALCPSRVPAGCCPYRDSRQGDRGGWNAGRGWFGGRGRWRRLRRKGRAEANRIEPVQNRVKEVLLQRLLLRWRALLHINSAFLRSVYVGPCSAGTRRARAQHRTLRPHAGGRDTSGCLEVSVNAVQYTARLRATSFDHWPSEPSQISRDSTEA